MPGGESGLQFAQVLTPEITAAVMAQDGENALFAGPGITVAEPIVVAGPLVATEQLRLPVGQDADGETSADLLAMLAALTIEVPQGVPLPPAEPDVGVDVPDAGITFGAQATDGSQPTATPLTRSIGWSLPVTTVTITQATAWQPTSQSDTDAVVQSAPAGQPVTVDASVGEVASTPVLQDAQPTQTQTAFQTSLPSLRTLPRKTAMPVDASAMPQVASTGDDTTGMQIDAPVPVVAAPASQAGLPQVPLTTRMVASAARPTQAASTAVQSVPAAAGPPESVAVPQVPVDDRDATQPIPPSLSTAPALAVAPTTVAPEAVATAGAEATSPAAGQVVAMASAVAGPIVAKPAKPAATHVADVAQTDAASSADLVAAAALDVAKPDAAKRTDAAPLHGQTTEAVSTTLAAAGSRESASALRPEQVAAAVRTEQPQAARPDPNPMERAVANQVSRAIIQHLPDGGTRMVMRLTPPELGTVRVEFVMRDGVMNARLMAEDDGVRQALDRALPHIRSEVRGEHPTFDVTVDRSDQRQAWQEGHARQDRRDDPRFGSAPRRRDGDAVFSIDGVEATASGAAAPLRAAPVLGGRVSAQTVDALA
jgi:flagellar hook-length control protein FliK